MAVEVTAEKMAEWRLDPVKFARDCVRVVDPRTGRLGRVKLLPDQEEFLREAGERDDRNFLRRKTCIASWPKRHGKTLCVAILIAWRLACWQRQRCGILANSEKQAQSNLFDAVSSIFRDSPVLADWVPDEELQATSVRVPALLNEVKTYAANWRTIQGTAFDVVACDELHASEDGGRAFEFASNQTEAANAQVYISSQAGMPTDGNPMWRYYQMFLQGRESVFFSYGQEIEAPWAKSLAEEAQHSLLPAEYDYLWRNVWGALGGQKLFSPEMIEAACAGSYQAPRTRDDWRDLCEELGPGVVAVGVDRAGVGPRGDRSVVSAVAAFYQNRPEPEYRLLTCDVLPTGSEAEVLESIARVEEIAGSELLGVAMEAYNCGDLVDRVPGARLVWPSTPAQQRWFTALYRAMSEGRFLFDARAGIEPKKRKPGLLKAELLTLEYEQQPGGGSKFGTQKGAHDDTVYGTAIALAEAANFGDVGDGYPFAVSEQERSVVEQTPQPEHMLDIHGWEKW